MVSEGQMSLLFNYKPKEKDKEKKIATLEILGIL